MTVKEQIQEFAANNERFTFEEVTEVLDLNKSTARKAIHKLIEQGKLTQEGNIIMQAQETPEVAMEMETTEVPTETEVPEVSAESVPEVKVRKQHVKIQDILFEKFAVALNDVNLIIPQDATPEQKKEIKNNIKTALSVFTYENTKDLVAQVKNSSKYNDYHLEWYKSKYVRDMRKSIAA